MLLQPGSLWSAGHFNSHKQLWVVTSVLSLCILLSVSQIHLCCCVYLVRALARFPQDTSDPPSPAPTNRPEMGVLLPAPRGAAPSTTGIFPGVGHHTKVICLMSAEWLHESARPCGGREQPCSECLRPCWPSVCKVTCAVTTEVMPRPASTQRALYAGTHTSPLPSTMATEGMYFQVHISQLRK